MIKLIFIFTLLSLNFLSAKVNIILIVVDDLGYADLSHMGQMKDVSTPNIERLTKTGIRFDNAYATAPICNASRIAIITGAYQQRQGQYWYGGPGLHNKKFGTIAESLKEVGYVNGYIGKYHHGNSDTPDKRGFPLNHGFDHFYGFSGGTKHYLKHSTKFGDNMPGQGPMFDGREKKNIEGFATELFGQEARKFIQKNKHKPFYLHLSFSAVHNFTHQLPKSYLEEKGLNGFKDAESKKTYWNWRKKIGYPAHPEGRAYYLGQLYFLDREIGLLIDQLNDLKLRENTVIFFISDNGGSLVTYANNGKYKGGKYTLYEGGCRVPLIISHTKLKQGESSNALVSAMDLYPTIAELTGAKVLNNIDGISLIPVIEGKTTTNKRYLYWDTKHQKAVRYGKWKFLKTEKVPNSKLQISKTPKGEFLYDLEKDPGESTNLANQYPEVMQQLKKSLLVWQNNIKEQRKN